MMETANGEVIERWVAAINAHDPAAIMEVLSEDFGWELGAAATTGREVSAHSWQLFFEGFPDFQMNLEQLITSEEWVVLRGRMTGTHQGNFRFRGIGTYENGLPPTLRSIQIPVAGIFEVRAGLIVRNSAFWDTATLLRQLGVLSL